ncbi:hypothetical protein FE257_009803 [Aspergillus nanangensis]|uniref:JmjC domain-containing protein n=1 Tax=Aspergillus nanangensis TaxID=2582783 RepID=A0AAD4GSH0_ASPNN|nr:hypothetical protein FE257_009803 [Aspergillus nanangensis]
MKFQRWHRYGSPQILCRQSHSPGQFNPPNDIIHRASFSTRNSHDSIITRHKPLGTLEKASVDYFRENHFAPELPSILPRSLFRDLPAFGRWFQSPPSAPDVAQLNLDYLGQHGSDVLVPLELTQSASFDEGGPAKSTDLSFRQLHAPLSLFLEWMRVAETQPQSSNLYLAQCQLIDLPQPLRDDFPTPDLVLQTGKGDIYDTNLWIGRPPTYTPLHRDPNPNLFVQLAGRKVVRLLAPHHGQALFASIRRQLGLSGGRDAAAIRGIEMMQGQERTLLEQAVWNDEPEGVESMSRYEGYEASLQAGDGLFIPKGWWHSIKGVGSGVTASNNLALIRSELGKKIKKEEKSIDSNNQTPLSENAIAMQMPPFRISHATLFHLIFTPLISVPVRASITRFPSQSLNRAFSVTYPECSAFHLYQHANAYSTMSTNNPDQPNQPQDNQNQELKEQSTPLALPEVGSDSKPTQLDVSNGESTAKLDHLGPLVVNQDGTLSRISNWDQMTDIEQKNTLRVLGKRNKLRMEALKSAEGAAQGQEK